jgi:hypothetical protein
VPSTNVDTNDPSRSVHAPLVHADKTRRIRNPGLLLLGRDYALVININQSAHRAHVALVAIHDSIYSAAERTEMLTLGRLISPRAPSIDRTAEDLPAGTYGASNRFVERGNRVKPTRDRHRRHPVHPHGAEMAGQGPTVIGLKGQVGTFRCCHPHTSSAPCPSGAGYSRIYEISARFHSRSLIYSNGLPHPILLGASMSRSVLRLAVKSCFDQAVNKQNRCNKLSRASLMSFPSHALIPKPGDLELSGSEEPSCHLRTWIPPRSQ